MEEQTVYGIKACLALLEHRPDDVLRIFHHASLRPQLGSALSWAAARRLPYRELDDAALEKVAHSKHHEGLVVVSRPLRYRALDDAAIAAAAIPPGGGAPLWLVLDGVQNPHNLGAILRSAAFFAASGLVVGGEQPEAKVNAAVPRVAEGGAEVVPLYGVPRPSEGLRRLRDAGVAVIGLETDASRDWWEAIAEGVADGPTALVLGHERTGLDTATRRACGLLCAIAAPGAVSSLNVSVTAAIALGEITRHRRVPVAPRPPARRPPAAPGGRPRPRGRR